MVIGAYQPVATLISWARHVGFNPVFATISFVGSNALAGELGPDGRGVLVSQVVPFPAAGNIAIAVQYRRALSVHAPGTAPGFVSFEGYLAGKLTITALEGCGPDVRRSCLTVIGQDGRYHPIRTLRDVMP